MARFRTSVDVDLPATEVFPFLEDFSNAPDWDPGVERAERLDEGPIGLGSRFALFLKVGASIQRWVYVVSDHDADATTVEFTTHGRFAEGVDRATVVPRGDDACTVEWDATFGFTGLGRLVDPAFQLVFNRIGAKAADGLEQAMRRMEQAAAA